MKAPKIIYWASTIIFAAFFTVAGILYLTHSPRMITRLSELGYPLYLLDILGTAKILGAVALVVPNFRRLKEWAYAGFVFDFVGAIWSHVEIQGLGHALIPCIPLTLVLTSYVSYQRLGRPPQ